MISERPGRIPRRTLSETQSAGLSFTVTPQLRYFPDRAMISWIRTAYLAAFALSGWRYILQPALQPIQDQLKHPSAVTPVLNDPRSLRELARSLGARTASQFATPFKGDMYPWPSRPAHLLDPAPATLAPGTGRARPTA